MFAKKKQIAVACVLAGASAAYAQSSVSLYGMLDVTVGSFDVAHPKGSDTRVTKETSSDMQTSYFGLSGVEDLGSGLKADFTLQSFIAPNTGATITNKAGAFWGRDSFVGLSGDFGHFVLGQYDSVLFISALTYNPFGSSFGYSPTMRHLYNPTVGNVGVGFDTTWVNSLSYVTPTMSGFKGELQFSPKGTSVAGSANGYAGSLSYDAGPFSATLTGVKSGLVPGANSDYTADDHVWDIGASYDFGVLKGYFQFTNIKDITDALKINNYQLGVSVPVTGSSAILASYGDQKAKPESGGSTTKDDVFSIAYDYNLSKRTDVYAVVSDNTHTALASGTSVGFGIRHNF